jgi:hypothetical protein
MALKSFKSKMANENSIGDVFEISMSMEERGVKKQIPV